MMVYGRPVEEGIADILWQKVLLVRVLSESS